MSSSTRIVSIFDLFDESPPPGSCELEKVEESKTPSAFKLSNKTSTFKKKRSKKDGSAYYDVELHFSNQQSRFQKSIDELEGKLQRAKGKQHALLQQQLEHVRQQYTNFHLNTIMIYTQYTELKKLKTTGTALTEEQEEQYQNLIQCYFEAVGVVRDQVRSSKTTYETCDVCGESMERIQTYKVCVNASCSKYGMCAFSQEYKISYKDLHSFTTRNNYSYQRIQRFKEIMSDIQSKHAFKIPPDVLYSVRQEIEKDNITDMRKLTHSQIKSYLKRLNFSTWYPQIPYILNQMAGVKSLVLTAKEEKTLEEMFILIEEQFEDIKQLKSRKNFFSYPYIIFKCSQLLGWHHVRPHLTLLKEDKLRGQDEMWKLICDKNGWEYLPSV